MSKHTAHESPLQRADRLINELLAPPRHPGRHHAHYANSIALAAVDRGPYPDLFQWIRDSRPCMSFLRASTV